jgi:proteasome accessory factor C
VDRARVLGDLEEITARSFYHPAGGAEDLQILIEGDRVRVWTKGEFKRPIKLSPSEALAAALGLRAMLIDDSADDAPARRLLQRIESDLSALSPEDVEARFGKRPLEDRVALADLDPDPEGIRETLIAAARERRPCRIVYLKPGATKPEERTLHPWVAAYGEGAWYAIGHCVTSDGVRVFRMDRILAAETLEGRFAPPEGFDPAEHLKEGRVFVANDYVPAVLRYSPRIARWLVERIDGESGADGAFVAGHRVSDPAWLVRHALQYGADAEVLEPPEIRALIADVAARMAV